MSGAGGSRRRAVAGLTALLALTAWAPTRGEDGRMVLIERTPEGVRLRPVASGVRPTWAIIASDGQRRLVMPDPQGDPEQAVVVLRGAPLALRGSARAAAGTTLEQQHARVRAAIGQLGGLARAARADPIRYEYRQVLNGFAVTLSRDGQAALARDPDVLAIHPDRPVHAVLDHSVPAVHAPEVWNQLGERGAGRTIAIVDTGIDWTHPDLGGCFGPGCKVRGGENFVGPGTPLDDNGHGTHVASIAAGNGVLDGVAPDASLLAYKVLDATGTGAFSTIIAALERAADPDQDGDSADHADVVNMSLGGGGGDPDDPLSQAVDAATAAGVVVVVAAGNDGAYFTVSSPALARTAIAVGASDDAGVRADFSSRGPGPGFGIKPEIMAPGVSICAARAAVLQDGTSCRDDRHVLFEGTSMASPHVAGAAALLRGLHPALDAVEVRSLLVQQAHPVAGGVMDVGTGFLDVLAAATAHTTVVPATLDFGLVDLSQPTWTVGRTLTLRNLDTSKRSYTVTATALPHGGGVTCTPQKLVLAPGQSSLVACSAAVDTAVLPVRSSLPFTYEGTVLVSSAGETQRVPFAFLEPAELRVHIDDTAGVVMYVHNRRDGAARLFTVGEVGQFLLPPDTYDVIVEFGPRCDSPASCGPDEGYCLFNGPPSFCSSGHRIVVREGVEVTRLTDVSISRAEAVHTIRFEARDEVGGLLDTSAVLSDLLHVDSQLGFGGFLARLPDSVRMSPVSAHYNLGISARAAKGEETYFVTDGVTGVAGDRTLGNAGGDLTRAMVEYHPHPGEDPSVGDVLAYVFATPIELGPYLSLIGYGIGGPAPKPGLAWPLSVSVAPERPWRFLFYETVDDGDAAGARLVYFGPSIQGDTTPGAFDVFGFFQNREPVYRVVHGDDLPLNLGPLSWAFRITATSPSVLGYEPAVGESGGPFRGQGGDQAFVNPVRWRLSGAGAGYATGMFYPQSGVGYLPLGGPAAAHLHVEGPTYLVGGLGGVTDVDIDFDTRRADPEPPVLLGLRLRSNGHLTDTVVVGAPVTIEVDAGGASAARLRVGQTEVAAAPVRFERYVATLDDPCAGSAGGVFLALVLTDEAGNTTSEAWNPGFTCMRPTCGDGSLDPGELCDDGNRRDGDGCNSTCTSDERCGNAILDFLETCDDGNPRNGDGCSTACAREARCGDGFPDPGEQCDDGNTHDGDCCSATCQMESQPACTSECRNFASGTPCNDGDRCTLNDQCGGLGCRGQPLVCGTGDPCSPAHCDPASGCVLDDTCAAMLRCGLDGVVPPRACLPAGRWMHRLDRLHGAAQQHVAAFEQAVSRCHLHRARRQAKRVRAIAHRMARVLARHPAPPSCGDALETPGGTEALITRIIRQVGTCLPSAALCER